MTKLFIVRLFLAVVGVTYVGLAAWCSVVPEKTSKVVGFALQPGSGQSEFLTVYGGLELGLGLVFLWPLYRSADWEFALLTCVIVHGCLVVFRTIGFVVYGGVETTTYYLAGTEWAIFLIAAALWAWKG